MKRITGVGSILVVLAWSCGGSSGTDTGSPDGSTGDFDATIAGDTGTRADGGGTTGADASGVGADSGVVSAVDAADGTVLADGGRNVDAGPGGSTSSLPCGTAACAIPGETCCIANSTRFACVAGSSCANVGGGDATALACTSSANCPTGSVCCVGDHNGIVAQCKTTCGQNEAQLCDPTAAATGCAQGVQCSSDNIGDWNLPHSFATCGGVGN